MKKCHKCNGRGFLLERLTTIKTSGKLGFGLYENGIKVPCTKCFGKGHK
ncbi:hypothetical protein [Bacillus sp. M6-12]|nr:hypothetical protein [Bacillus sp. M6-12]